MMAESRRSRLAPDDGRVALLVGCFLLLVFAMVQAALTENAYHAHWTLEVVLELFRDLGIAAIVGGIVSLGIERVSRDRFHREISEEIHKIERNVINAAYRKRYPDAYTRMIEEALDGATFFKFMTSITIDLIEARDQLARDGETLLWFDQTSSHQIENITSEPQSLDPVLFVDVSWDGDIPKLMAWKVGEHRLSGAEIADVTQRAHLSKFQKWFSFPERVILAPGERLHVSSTVRTLKFARDCTTWCGMLPSDSLRFTINHPDGYQVYAQAKTPARHSDTPSESDGRRLTIEILSPLLPFITVELGWRRHATNGDVSAADTIGDGLKTAADAPTTE